MKLRRITVKNFRSLKDVSVLLDDTTVLVGENNSGKTALLHALQLALARPTAGRASVFDEYDFHLAKPGDSPETSDGIVVEVWFGEDHSGEWPDPVLQELQEIVQTDPDPDLDSIGLRISSKYDPATKDMATKTEFLALDGQPIGSRTQTSTLQQRFLNYVRLFYLSALRDSQDQFSPRSQYWGRMLKDIKIGETERAAMTDELARLNDSLLKADPRLEEIRKRLDGIQKILLSDKAPSTSIQALPLRPWDLLSRAELVVTGQPGGSAFPLVRHGQGMQSLAVLYLFHAYIEVLLKPTFRPETEAIIALEEPEAHLHPQATRALSANLQEIKSQKIISTHSPYFIQEVPFANIRLFRRDGPASTVLHLPRSFSLKLPPALGLDAFCKVHGPRITYQKQSSILSVSGALSEDETRDLLVIYGSIKALHPEIRNLQERSQHYLDDSELAQLDTFAKRMRGEILFARAWLLCEGQSEYLFLRYLADVLGVSLDSSGVAIIDYKNNGSAHSFARLARAFEIPWLLLCDSDQGGQAVIKELKTRAFSPEDLKKSVRELPGKDQDLESFVVTNGFQSECLAIVTSLGMPPTKQPGDAGFTTEVIEKMRKAKITCVEALIDKLRTSKMDKTRVPGFLKTIIEEIVARAR